MQVTVTRDDKLDGIVYNYDDDTYEHALKAAREIEQGKDADEVCLALSEERDDFVIVLCEVARRYSPTFCVLIRKQEG